MKLGKNNSKSSKIIKSKSKSKSKSKKTRKSNTLNKPNVYWTKECAEGYADTHRCYDPCVKKTTNFGFGMECVPDKKLVKLHKTQLREQVKTWGAKRSARKPLRIQRELAGKKPLKQELKERGWFEFGQMNL